MTMVRNVFLHPHPADDIDPVGALLRDLDRTVTDLQFIDPIRLYGDGVIIDGALIALKIIQQRIDGVKAQQQAAE